MRLNNLISCLILIQSMFYMQCSLPDTGGGTIETTNGITGSVHNNDKTPARNTVVKLLPENYDPVTDEPTEEKYIDTTDSNGKFSFRHIRSGNYNILARSSTFSTSFLIRNVDVAEDSVSAVSPGFLENHGVISADFSNTGSLDSMSYMYIPGTDIYSLIGSDGKARLDNIPAGVFTEVLLNDGDSKKVNILRDEITLRPEDSVTILNPLWKHSRRISLNTSPDGARINTDLYGFPVLIRLNSNNFDFSQAQTAGSDLCFTTVNNKPLPFEIERWDFSGKHAELWVKVDTIRGNDSTQTILMYSGALTGSVTSSLKNSSVVFDTAASFQGVWHMGDAGFTIDDATVNQYHGTSPDTARPLAAEGIIGTCREFDGSSDFITMPGTSNGKVNFEQNDEYTLSVWVRHDTFDGTSHCIVSKGYEQHYLRSTYISQPPSLVPQWEFVEFGEAGGTGTWYALNGAITEKQWSHVVGIRHGGKQLLYCDGVLVDSTTDIWQNTVSRNTGNDLYIGRFAEAITVPVPEGFCYFKGSIDEVRILNRAQSPDWVRLCYMNQRTDDRLVVFR